MNGDMQLMFAIYGGVVAIILAISGFKGHDLDDIIGISLFWPMIVGMVVVASPFIFFHWLGKCTKHKRIITIKELIKGTNSGRKTGCTGPN